MEIFSSPADIMPAGRQSVAEFSEKISKSENLIKETYSGRIHNVFKTYLKRIYTLEGLRKR